MTFGPAERAYPRLRGDLRSSGCQCGPLRDRGGLFRISTVFNRRRLMRRPEGGSMKKIIVLVMALALLAGCGAGVVGRSGPGGGVQGTGSVVVW